MAATITDNLKRYFLYELYKTPYRKPVKVSQTASLAIGASGSVTLNVPVGERWSIKSVTITKGADVTVSDIQLDGISTGETDTFDTQAIFGDVLSAEQTIKVTGANAAAATAAENLTVDVVGYSVEDM